MDTFLNIQDIIYMRSIVLTETTPDEYETWAADYNGDNAVNVMDILSLMDFIFSQQ